MQSCWLSNHTIDNGAHLTNHIKLLSTRPDLWQWCSPGQTGQLGQAVHLTISSTKMFTWPTKPTSWQVFTCNTRLPVTQGDDQVTQPRRLKVTHPCHPASQLTLMFTWPIRPSRPNRWHCCSLNQLGQSGEKSCSPDHTISIDVNLTNPVNQMTRISTWPTKSPRTTRWNWCSPDHPGETVAHQTISWTMKFTLPEVQQTYQTNQVKQLITWPYHELLRIINIPQYTTCRMISNNFIIQCF